MLIALLRLRVPEDLFMSNPPLNEMVDVPPIDCAPVPLKVTKSVGAHVPALEILPPIAIADAAFELRVIPDELIDNVPKTVKVPEPVSVLLIVPEPLKVRFPYVKGAIF